MDRQLLRGFVQRAAVEQICGHGAQHRVFAVGILERQIDVVIHLLPRLEVAEQGAFRKHVHAGERARAVRDRHGGAVSADRRADRLRGAFEPLAHGTIA